MVVDDDPVNTKLASVCLKKCGLQITTASDGKVAVELREKSATQEGAARFDLILMDCKMKMMDGDVAAKLIREFEGGRKLPSIPIIAFTGGGVNDKDDEFFFKAGMQGMVQKPL
uniref:Response regulatory domain-containing protein n=1 Tax=Guillardia theta (strain CCMP2712) TaxID=905079 RepID=A0A0C3TGG5_GUITC